jgi:enoyl-CoA hydratase/carnithine racemase
MADTVEIGREGDGTVAVVTMRGEGSVTPLTPAIVTGLEAALDEVGADPEVRVVLLTGAGRSFCVGADLKHVAGLSREAALTYNQGLIDLGTRLESIPPPVVACLNGAALGGGLELALACSLRIASDEAVLGLPEVKLGIVPGAGGLIRLPRMIGDGAAMSMLLSGRTVSAAEALTFGLVNEVIPAEELGARSLKLALELAARGPLALRLIKRVARETAPLPEPDAIAAVQAELGELLRSGDADEGVAAFIERRVPRFTGS